MSRAGRSGKPLLMVFLIDALGHRSVREWGTFAFLPFVDGPVASVCGYSSACIPSLLTGRTPAEHGHWGMYLRDPRASIFRRFRPVIDLVGGALGRDYLARRIVTKLLSRTGVRGYFSLYQIPLGLLGQFDLCEKADPYAPGGLAPHATPFDAAETLKLAWHGWHWRTPEAQRRRLFAEAVAADESDFLFFYSPWFDSVCHEQGTRSAAARDCLGDLADFVAAMGARAREKRSAVRILVCGDHGMADVTGIDDLLTPLRALPWRMPEDLLYFVDSTMARVWYFRAGVRERVEALLGAAGCGRILGDDECRALGVFFPDRRYGETIFLTHPGRMLVPSFMGATALRAMHGYHPEHEDSSTVVLTDFPHAPVTSILDIGPLITRELEALAAGGRPGAAGDRPAEAGRGAPGPSAEVAP
ncbi:MAG: alkaline phosphatase family protein [Candidatus Eisenbacteria bacterium]